MKFYDLGDQSFITGFEIDTFRFFKEQTVAKIEQALRCKSYAVFIKISVHAEISAPEASKLSNGWNW